jgi:dextranase
MTSLLPAKATFAPGEPIEVEVRGTSSPVLLTHLGDALGEAEPKYGRAQFDPLPEGGYGVGAGGADSAFDVLADPLSRPRYGFVSRFDPGRDPAGVAENIRRLHLNVIQFYDWMYRHARLLPPSERFADALGRDVSLDTVRRLVAAVADAGSVPLAYAAVYAVGAEARSAWQDELLYRVDGTPWTLGEFLWNVDPTSERWLAHFTGELRSALTVGFAGFHLDQYGSPKRALRSDSTEVDLAQAFPHLIDRVAAELPDERLIFNNVNDFPTWTTTRAQQDVTYIEVWPPHETLAQLGTLIARARSFQPHRPVVLATYLSPFAAGPGAGADQAQRLLLATVFSHGATALLHGEERGVLTEAYYVRHATLDDASLESTRRYYDFAVRHGDVLFDPARIDVSGSLVGGENREVRVEAAVPTSIDGRAGTLWVRAVACEHGLVLHLIDLSGQTDDRWNAPKRTSAPLEGITLAIERPSRSAPDLRFASPAGHPSLERVETAFDGRFDVVALPPLDTWGLILARRA